jgi:hypothetical protein
LPAPSWSPEGAATEVRALLAGRPPEHVELAESLLVPLVHQFGQMQVQMFDQFQQVLVVLFQMFSTMHREQMDLVREELAQIRRLTDELQATQAQLRQPPAPRPDPDESPRARPAPAGAGAGTPPRRKPTPPPPPPEASDAARQLHAVLTQRIAALQQERQSRWQKLLQAMGGGRGPATPS